MKMNLRFAPLAILASTLIPSIAAHAQSKPTLVVMHRNIGRAQDETNWNDLARKLSADGFRVISVALIGEQTTAEGTRQLRADLEGQRSDLIVVGTAAVADVANTFAEEHSKQVRAVVYLSAEGTVPAFGPRSVAVPTVLGKVPTYQVKVTDNRHATQSTEGPSTVYHVREQGTSTLPSLQDFEATLQRIARLNPSLA